MTRVRVKICGLRQIEHAQAAVEAGADLIGFVFAPVRRYVAPETAAAIARAVPSSVKKVGLFVNAPSDTVRSIVEQCGLDYAQLCGDETPEFCQELELPVVRSLRVRGPDVVDEVARFAPHVSWCILDGFQPNSYGGTGTSFDWRLAQTIARDYPIMVAGGLTPETVGEVIRLVEPFGVDVSSGVETAGDKDVVKIARFIAAARAAEREVS